MVKSIMIQGAGSNVGKSLLVAGLGRAFRNRGLRVAPFKPQNMSNNAAVTKDGGEIGRAQALQARACGLPPHTDMNPILLKPQSDIGAQVVVQGQVFQTIKARDYAQLKPRLMPFVLESYKRLSTGIDLIIVEGAGSPAETNLRVGDIANMGFAQAVNMPVILVGDIDRGGVIAQMIGTKVVLSPDDSALIKGFIINKFRGDISIFDDGLRLICEKTNWQNIGVLPWFSQAIKLPAEDASDIKPIGLNTGYKIVVPQLSRIANFDDIDPLVSEPNVSVEIISGGKPLPIDADMILIPGTKSTLADLNYFREQGWDIDLAYHIRRGGHVLGICGGYQILGREIHDEKGIEGKKGSYKGLGHLDIVTRMQSEKKILQVRGRSREGGAELSGYEIHIGQSEGPDCRNSWLEIEGRKEGAASKDGRIRGCYIHGLFNSDEYRKEFLQNLGVQTSGMRFDAQIDVVLDDLAQHLEQHLDLDAILKIAR